MESRDTLVDRLIRDAYGIVGRPERLISVLNEGDSGIASPEAGDVAAADRHFEQAGQLIDEVSSLVGTDFAGFGPASGDAGEAETGVVLAFDSGLRVAAVDRGQLTGPALEVGGFAPDWLWDPAEMHAAKSRVAECEPDQPAQIMRLFRSPEDETGQWYAMRCEGAGDDRRIVFTAMQFQWRDASGARFAEALALTDAERALTRHLVMGGTVRSFAEERGRSVGTARNQLKALCRKLAIGSQQELLMLYAGFAHSLQQLDDAPGERRHFCARIYHEPDGGVIAWEQYGDPDGFPVLFFHTFFDGALFTAEQDRAALAAGLRIIAPWRAYTGETTGEGTRMAMVRRFAERLDGFLSAQGVDRCAVLGMMVGAPWALGFAQGFPQRVCGVVLAGPAIPFASWGELRRLGTGQRKPMQLTRLAPKFARIYIRATLAGSLKGGFDTYLDEFFSNSPADRAYYNRPDIREMVRLSGTYTFVKSLEGPTESVMLQASDWSDLCRDIQVPVTVAVGTEPGAISDDLYDEFAGRFGFAIDRSFDRSSQLVLHDDPARVFALVRAGCPSD